MMLAEQQDPWKRMLERALPANVECMSVIGLLDILGFPPSTGNSRRLAKTMRKMGWVAIRSRRLAPGSWRSTECRGWAKPFRELR